jgi:predicted kinase
MKCKALKAGRNVVLDACHITEKARWHALQSPNSNYKKICVVFDLPWQTIRERCLSEKRVSLKEVERMWQAFQHSKPSPEELKLQGFDAVCFMTVEGDAATTPGKGTSYSIIFAPGFRPGLKVNGSTIRR